MIERYTEKDIAELWAEENRLKVMLDVNGEEHGPR